MGWLQFPPLSNGKRILKSARGASANRFSRDKRLVDFVCIGGSEWSGVFVLINKGTI